MMPRRPHNAYLATILAFALLLTASPLYATLSFNFTAIGNLADMQAGNQGAAQQALAQNVVDGFAEAGDLWSTIFDDPITINVDINFDNLGGSVLGSTGNVTAQSNFSPTKTALINDATSTDDATAVANFQPGASLDMLTINTAIPPAPVVRDDDGSANNFALSVSRSNLKALGIIAGNHGATDGSITFSDQFSWDFDRTPVGAEFDFVGVSAHEIGHLMGFSSGVDIVDITGGSGPSAPTDLDNFRVFSVLDLYRYSADSLAESNQPSSGAVLDLAYGGTPYFSIDAGVTNLGTFSTGVHNGDGRQASHWKDNLGLGIMDPTFANGEVPTITPLDILAFDVIGYDLAPPPPPTCGLGDADCDGDVDIGGDIFSAFENFTGPGTFGKIRVEGDVHSDATGGTTTTDPADGDVDVQDILVMFGNFTGPLDEGGSLAPSEAADPAIPDLIYDSTTGEVVLDVDGAGIIGYVLKNGDGTFIAGSHTPILAGVSTSLAGELAEAAFASSSGAHSIGLVFPTGMDLATLTAYLTTNEVSVSLGAPVVPFDLVVLGGAVPEPTTTAMALVGLLVLTIAFRRRSPR